MSGKAFKDFEVQIFGLDNGDHNYDFRINKSFFQLFPNSLVENGKGVAFLRIEKSETMMHLHFKLEVVVELICDVTLEEFDFPIHTEDELIIKFGEEEIELSEDVMIINRNATSINVAKFIYEFVSLAIPMKKLHPKIKDQERSDLIYSDKSEDVESSEEEIDPRWEVLKKLKK